LIENIVRQKLKITYIGHSLGGMILPMYISLMKRQKEDHYLSKAILLSPCGTNFHANWMILLFAHMCTKVTPHFSGGIGMPEFLMKIL